MTKFYKLQKISSVIPFYSTFVIFIVTMITLKRYKAPTKAWFQFAAAVFLSTIAVYVLNAVLMSGQHIILNFFASGLILAVANIICVDLQIKYAYEETVKIKQKPVILLCIILLGSVMVSLFLLLEMFFSPTINIEDTNGINNTNLTMITIDEILSSSDEYSAKIVTFSNSGEQTNVTGRLKGVDYDRCSFSSKKISGVKTLQATKSNSESMTLEIQSNLTAGNMAIIIMIDGNYHSHVKLNQTDTIVLDDIAGKTVLIKLAAESAQVEVLVSRSIN